MGLHPMAYKLSKAVCNRVVVVGWRVGFDVVCSPWGCRLGLVRPTSGFAILAAVEFIVFARVVVCCWCWGCWCWVEG